jgi:hypothetical protein
MQSRIMRPSNVATKDQMATTFWTAEKDKQLRKLEAAGLSAAQIADRLGTTRNAVLGRSVRLRGLTFPSQIQRERTKRALHAADLRQREERAALSLASMRRLIARGTPRNMSILSAIRDQVTYRAIGDELGISWQRVQQIVTRAHHLGTSRRLNPASPEAAAQADRRREDRS